MSSGASRWNFPQTKTSQNETNLINIFPKMITKENGKKWNEKKKSAAHLATHPGARIRPAISLNCRPVLHHDTCRLITRHLLPSSFILLPLFFFSFSPRSAFFFFRLVFHFLLLAFRRHLAAFLWTNFHFIVFFCSFYLIQSNLNNLRTKIDRAEKFMKNHKKKVSNSAPQRVSPVPRPRLWTRSDQSGHGVTNGLDTPLGSGIS